MKRITFIITLAAIVVLAATGCANKRKAVKRTYTKPMPQEQTLSRREAKRLQEEQQRRRLDSIALAQAEAEAKAKAQAEAARQQELERQRLQDSIAQAEAEKKARVQTMYISRMAITVQIQGQQLSLPATMRWQRGKGIILSIQPFAGIEAMRAELNEEALLIIDKFNRRYTRLTYADLALMGTNTNINEIDAWIDKNILDRRNEPQLNLQVSRAGINGAAVIYTNTLQTDVNINMQPTNIGSYRQVTLEQMVKGL
ncbi:MAG: DUF4292 domain-containing protein [Paludibacteraceae bacterium]|nr:DUF4292 domain-containing protein [Paludibacteraceae bacterium]